MSLESLLTRAYPDTLHGHAVLDDEHLTIALHSTTTSATCPDCGTPSRYERTLTDVPYFGLTVTVHLTVRRFHCAAQRRTRRTFTEQLPEITAPYARITTRLKQQLELVAVMVGAEPGSRLLRRFFIHVSPNRLLRLLYHRDVPETRSCDAVGIDEFAFPRGNTYGTVIVDLRTGRTIDLLPHREVQTVAVWLAQHPEIRIVTRDSSKEFAAAITLGAPQAVQVLDRWHVLKNLREALERDVEVVHQETLKVLTYQQLMVPPARRIRKELAT